MSAEHIWITSSHSGSEGNCVQVAAAGNQVHIRDSSHTHGPILTIPAPAWRQLTSRLRASSR